MSASHSNNGFAPLSPGHAQAPRLPHSIASPSPSSSSSSSSSDLLSINENYYNNLYSPTKEEISLNLKRCQTQLTVQDVNLFVDDITMEEEGQGRGEYHHQRKECGERVSKSVVGMKSEGGEVGMGEVVEDESIYCPASLVACLIGKGGKTISYIQDKSKTNIQIERSISAVRRINIRGRSIDDVTKAKEMVYSILGSGCTDLYYSNNQSYQFGITRAIECPKILIGRVIGKQGRTMRMLESIYSIKISVFQGGDPCTINIFGTQSSVNRVTEAISQLVEGQNPIDVVSKSFNLMNSYSTTTEKNIW